MTTAVAENQAPPPGIDLCPVDKRAARLAQRHDDRIILSTHIVEDIDSTCRNVAVLDEGTLLFYGTISELRKQAEGKIYSLIVPAGDYKSIKDRYTLLSVQDGPDGIYCRVLSDIPPMEAHTREQPILEDGYMQLLCSSKGVR